MAKRRVKKRTHTATRNGQATPGMGVSPRSMVIRTGAAEVGPSVSQLAKDMRLLMEPETATRLKERKSNKLRDYTTMAGPLGVTHLLLFSRSSAGNTSLRIAKFPRGPTLHFRVTKYSLCKDIQKAQRRPKNDKHEYHTAPLLVMNNFTSDTANLKNYKDDNSSNPTPKHLEQLAITMFQSMFPPITPQVTPLSSIRRVLLLNREPTSDESEGPFTLKLRHFAITTAPVQKEIPKSIRKINAAEKLLNNGEKRKRAVPNLGKLDDIADYMLDPSAANGGFTSGSDSEQETDAEVEVLTEAPRKVLGKREKQQGAEHGAGKASENTVPSGRRGVQKRAVKLIELGPRMTLRLMKVEEGLCNGKVMWHEHVTKSKEEEKELDEIWETRRREKIERKRIQKENIERKRKLENVNEDIGEGGTADAEMMDHEMYDSDDFYDGGSNS